MTADQPNAGYVKMKDPWDKAPSHTALFFFQDVVLSDDNDCADDKTGKRETFAGF